MAKIGTLVIESKVDNKGIEKGFKGIKSSVSGLMSSLKLLGGAIAGAFAVGAIVAFGKESKALYKEQLFAEQKLASAMQQRMGASAQVVQGIIDYTSELQKLGVIGDEVQLAGAAQAATFLDNAESLKLLIPAMNNALLASKGLNATTQDAQGIGNLFGKVMQGEVSALKEVGITFTEAEKQVLLYGNEVDRASTLAQVITNNFGDLNSILAQTDLGKQQQLSNTLGDIREQFGAVAVQVGSLLLPLFTAFNSMLITVVNSLRTVASMLTYLFGSTAEAQSNQSSSTDKLTSSTNALSGSLKKSGKAAKGSLASFDTLNTLTQSIASNSEDMESTGDVSAPSFSSSGMFEGGINVPIELSPEVMANLERVKVIIDDIKSKSTIVLNFAGFGIDSLVNSIRNSFNPDGLFAPLTNWFSGIGPTLISTFASNVFNNFLGIFGMLFGYIQELGAIFSVPFQTLLTVGLTVFNGLLTGMIMTLTPLFELVKTIFSSIYEGAIKPAMELIAKIVNDTLLMLGDWWDEYGVRVIQGLTEFIAGVTDTFNLLWSYVQPIVADFLAELTWLWDNHIKGLVENVMDFVGRLLIAAKDIYNGFIKPLIDYLIVKLMPTVQNIFATVVDVIGTAIATIVDVASGIITVFKGVIEFLTGIFTLDFERVLAGLSEMLSGTFEIVAGLFKGIINTVIGVLNTMVRGINKISFTVPDWVPAIGGSTFGLAIPEIPKLATGAVIPPNREFLAVLGDQSSGTNIETPLSTMVDAFRTAMREFNGGGSSGDIVIKVGEMELARATVKAINSLQRQTGKPQIVF